MRQCRYNEKGVHAVGHTRQGDYGREAGNLDRRQAGRPRRPREGGRLDRVATECGGVGGGGEACALRTRTKQVSESGRGAWGQGE